MMNSTSSCIDGYGNFMMHQQQVSSNFYNQNNNNNGQKRYQGGSYGNQSEWSGVPIGKSSEDSRHKKLYNSRSNEYDDSSMSRLAKHTHGAPIIMSSRYRSKSVKSTHSLAHENANLQNQNSIGCLSKAPSSDEMHNYDDSGYHANGTCLPRIIKPRKRRKKDRKPISSASMENNPLGPFTFASNQSNGFMQSMSANSNNNSNNTFSSSMIENFNRPSPLNDCNLFFNCDFDTNFALPLPSSTSSSPISLSNSSLSSSTMSSCSCRLCDPNCKIWAFPLRRSFSDNTAVEIDHHNNGNSDGVHIETGRKDVGVIGGNRVKTEWNSVSESTFSILDMIEFNDYKNQQNALLTDVNRLRSESLSDSGDSGCDLILGGLNISDDILSSTIKTVGDSFTSEGLNAITKHLSEFNLIASQTGDVLSKEINVNDSDLSHLDANESADNRVCTDNIPAFQFNTITKSLSSCEFGGHQRRNNLDNLLAMNTAASGRECNYGNLMSPMLVNKHNYSNNVDLNNNHLGAAPTVDGATVGLKERTMLFDCFDAAWKGS